MSFSLALGCVSGAFDCSKDSKFSVNTESLNKNYNFWVGAGGGEAGNGLEEFVKYITCIYMTIHSDPNL